MYLVIDIGNTNIVFAVYKKDKILKKWRIATIINRTKDEYFIFMKQSTISDYNIKGIIIGSVVPEIVIEISNACKELFNKVAYILNENVAIKFNSDVENPSEVGTDRIVNSLYAWSKYKKAAIIIDFGTATTFDVIDSKGTYLGGVICPGVNLSLQALHKAAARLPRIAIKKTKNTIGKNTVEAMSSGIYWGYIGLIKFMLEKIKSELNCKVVLIATGGLADFFVDQIADDVILDKDTTIHGLYLAYKEFSKK